MDYRGFSSTPDSRSAVSWRKLLNIVLLATILVVLIAIEPINKVLVRDVIKKNATDQQLSHFANEIVIQSLLCRRFEKDILLTINNRSARESYQAQWKQAALDLDLAITAFQVTALHQSDREQAASWKAASSAYQQEVLELFQAIDAGTIIHPTEANQLLTSGKGSIRALTDSATTVADAKDAAVEASSSMISSTLAMSSRVITLLILAGCIIWTTFRVRA